MKELCGASVRLFEGSLLRREAANREYLMKLKTDHLLRNYELEAGRYSGRGHDPEAFDGWEDPTCQLRGHFLGHWLSAAALAYQETGDRELLAKTEAILRRLALCQRDNGGEWACPIPEKFLHWIGAGKEVWAPQYTIHKLLMGLVDVYRLMRLNEALSIADKLADWFVRWSAGYTREQFDRILDVETGGMLEVWADLLEITGDAKYRVLLERYDRRRFFEPLLEGRDVLTNMHANTTIPEVLGCARAFEVTGEERWYRVVEQYWKCAVTDRGSFATGGQTQGEIWTPMRKLKARLGDKNQEHCTVYNMIRLAEFLFRQTKDPAYMHYIEYNVQNGLLAQAYWHNAHWNAGPDSGLLTYFLPMKAGSRKDWAGETDSFFCCHGTMVQANAAWNRRIFYLDENALYVTTYADAEADFALHGRGVRVAIRQDHMNGSLMTSSENKALQAVNETACAHESKPDFRRYIITVKTDAAVKMAVLLRIPDWIARPAAVSVSGEGAKAVSETDRFFRIERTWSDGDQITVELPVGLRFVPLPDDPQTGAFRYGADVLAGITEKERILFLEGDRPEDELSADTEREWGTFLTRYRTENQDPGISFLKLNEIGYEPYQIYFKTRKR